MASSLVVIASAAKQSIYPLCRALDCFAPLAMTRRVPGVKCQADLRSVLGSRTHAARNFFIIFVDGMFTTFIARLFTNAFDASRKNSAIACV